MSDFFLINKSWSGNMIFLIMVWNFYIFENGPNTGDGLADRRGCGVDHSSFLMSGRQIFAVDGLADRRGCGVDHSSFLMSGLCMGQTPIAI